MFVRYKLEADAKTLQPFSFKCCRQYVQMYVQDLLNCNALKLVPVLLTMKYIERWQTQFISDDTVIELDFL